MSTENHEFAQMPSGEQRIERVLIVDDEPTICALIREALEAKSFDIDEVYSVSAAREMLEEKDFDLVISDVIMNDESGIDLLNHIRRNYPDLPVIIMSAFTEMDVLIEAINNGAHSFIKKPFRMRDFHEAVKNSLAKRRYDRMREEFHQHLSRTNSRLRQEVVDSVVQHNQLFLGSLAALAQTIDARDPYTCQHSASVAALAKMVSRHMGLSREDCDAIEMAGQLHDLGKIGVPETILLKPSRLTTAEYEVMKLHPIKATGILRSVPGLETAIPAIHSHHEHFNGEGYPEGLKGTDIPLFARILGVCDTWDAMTSNRPYRRAMPIGTACTILDEERGRQLDPDITALFLDLVEKEEISPSQRTTKSARFLPASEK